MTYDFVMGQLRLIAVGIIAWLVGSGKITKQDATNLEAILYPAGLLAAPVLWSWYVNWQKKIVPHGSIAIDGSTAMVISNDGTRINKLASTAKIVGAILVAFMVMQTFFMQAFAADNLPVKTPIASSSSCQTAGNCSGGYLDFGVDWDAALAAAITNGGSNNGGGLNFGGGYQLWQNQLLAGIEGNGGYRFGTAGSTGSFTATVFGKLGYNFFPASASAAPAPAQNPFAGFVPATLLQNSTPSIIAGGCLGHGVLKGCGGLEIDTVIAAGWSTAAQLYNAPSVKGQPDETVFRLLVQKHF